MKNLFLIILLSLFISFTDFIEAQWFSQNNPAQNSSLSDVFAIDENTVISVGSNYPTARGIILKTTDGGENWLINLVDTLGYYSSICFVNQDIGWVGGGFAWGDQDFGIILKTTNTGNHWIKDTIGSGALNSIHFVDQNTGWTAGIDRFIGFLRKTTNGGTNWIHLGLSGFLRSVFFINQNTGWVIGGEPWESSILRTTDGGTDWVTKTFSSFFPRSIYFIDSNIGWAAGNENFTNLGLIYKTTDGGENWVNQPVGIDKYLYDIYFVDENIGWAVGSDGIILCTTNGGLNWITQVSSTSNDLYSVHFINENTGWVVGENGTILKTTNGGIIPVELTSFTAIAQSNFVELKWSTATETNNSGFEIERSEDDVSFNKIGFVQGFGTTTEPKSYCYADQSVKNGTFYYRLKQVDYDGSYEYSDVVEVNLNVPIEYGLQQNYPNPFNPSTSIKYSIPVEIEVRLEILNVLGEQVELLINETKTAGTYDALWNASNMSSGVYFYRLQAGSFVETKKMILLR
jgi:photosystem II stability/assembly factor-like uncharacterized protein